jgi:hypothetical protein
MFKNQLCELRNRIFFWRRWKHRFNGTKEVVGGTLKSRHPDYRARDSVCIFHFAFNYGYFFPSVRWSWGWVFCFPLCTRRIFDCIRVDESSGSNIWSSLAYPRAEVESLVSTLNISWDWDYSLGNWWVNRPKSIVHKTTWESIWGFTNKEFFFLIN